MCLNLKFLEMNILCSIYLLNENKGALLFCGVIVEVIQDYWLEKLLSGQRSMSFCGNLEDNNRRNKDGDMAWTQLQGKLGDFHKGSVGTI